MVECWPNRIFYQPRPTIRTVRVQIESTIPASPAELWDWSTSVRGVHAEMRPILKLAFPKGMTHIPRDGSGLGQPLGNCTFLLLGELGEVAVAGQAQHFHAFFFHGGGQRANAESRGVLGTEVLVDDDDRESKFHGQLQSEAPCTPSS